MIAKDIYDGKTAEELGLTEEKYRDRKETLDLFLWEWNGDDFEKDYLHWLTTDYNLRNAPLRCNHGEAVVEEDPDDITFGEMFKGLTKSIKAIAASGVAMVDNDLHAKRYQLCINCEHFDKGRCRACGCFMKVKSKFSAMECPVGKWGKVK